MITVAKEKEAEVASNEEIKERLQGLTSEETELAQEYIVLLKYNVVSEAMDKLPESPVIDFITIVSKLFKA